MTLHLVTDAGPIEKPSPQEEALLDKAENWLMKYGH